MVKKKEATIEDIQRAIKREMKQRLLRRELGVESEISHYSENSDGEVKRTIVKKSEATMEDIQRALKREI